MHLVFNVLNTGIDQVHRTIELTSGEFIFQPELLSCTAFPAQAERPQNKPCLTPEGH